MFNDTSLVINKDVLNVLGTAAICAVCKGVIINPMQCIKCDNCFCKQCALSWKRQNKGCPFKCQFFKTRQSNLMLKLLSSLKFSCISKCGEEVPYLQLEGHYMLKCTKIDFKAQFLALCDKLNKTKTSIEQMKKERDDLIKDLSLGNLQTISDNDEIYISKYHPHPLKKSISNNHYRCDICRESIYGDNVCYSCRNCDYDYCQLCREEEDKEDAETLEEENKETPTTTSQ